MTPEQREQAIRSVTAVLGRLNEALARQVVDRAFAPLLAEERRAGAEKGWADGWSAHKMLGDAISLSENPYRADRITQNQLATEYVCPSCRVERADYEGPRMHLPDCPNCGSHLTPRVDQPQHNHDPIGVYNGCPACGTDWQIAQDQP